MHKINSFIQICFSQKPVLQCPAGSISATGLSDDTDEIFESNSRLKHEKVAFTSSGTQLR